QNPQNPQIQQGIPNPQNIPPQNLQNPQNIQGAPNTLPDNNINTAQAPNQAPRRNTAPASNTATSTQKTSSDNPNKIDVNKSPFSEYYEHLNCIAVPKSIFTDNDNIFIMVSDPEIVKKSFFSAKYTQYKLQIKDSEEPPVIRKLEDFNWLHMKLKDLFPGCLVPPTAPSHLNLKDDSPKTLSYLSRFINAVCEIKTFRSTELVTDFLTMKQEEFNKKRKDVFEKEMKPRQWSQYKTMEGFLNIYINKEKDDYAQSINREINKFNSIYKRIDDDIDILNKQFEEISKTLGDLGKAFGELSMAYDKDEICVKGMNWFKDFFNKWSEGYKEQKDFFTFDLKYYFKYISKEFDLMLPLTEDFKSVKATYEERFKKFLKSPIKTEREELQVVQAKKGYAYYLAKAVEEYDLLRKRQQRRLTKQFIVLSERKEKFIKDCTAFSQLLNFETY
ncbi:MAG: hypothetical protein MJ252_25290, partial [archaeon]|nr:hypothetical protein [archaeon]